MAEIVVAGAGVAGLAATVALARAGHSVVLVERDQAPPPPEPGDAFLGWDRPGVPQRKLVHGFLPLARRLLRQHVPDIVDRLFAAGAHDVDLLAPVPSRRPSPGDQDLYVLRCRRMVFEWVLRRCAGEHRGVRVLSGETVTALAGLRAARGRLPRVTGVRLASGTALAADLVVDATGRRSPVARWLRELGGVPPVEESEPCGLVYFSRFYERPVDGFPVAYRANLGYAHVGAAGADGRTFSLTFFARAEEPGLRLLRRPAAFERAVASIPGFAPWREGARPLGEVSAMGALENRLRRFVIGGRPCAAGLILIGDSLGHTNPVLGRGMSLALDHAFRAAAQPWSGGRLVDCALGYQEQVGPMAEASHADAVESDRLAARLYAGDPGAAEEPRALVTEASARAATADQDLYRAGVRHTGLLDWPGAIVREPWIGRARAVLARSRSEPAPGPSREHLLALLAGGGGSKSDQPGSAPLRSA